MSPDLLISKLGGAALLFLVSAFGILLPNVTEKFNLYTQSRKRLTTLLVAFAGGLFTGLVFFHLLPEAVHEGEENHLVISFGDESLSVVWIYVFFGFLAALFIVRTWSCPHENCTHDDHRRPSHSVNLELLDSEDVQQLYDVNLIPSDANANDSHSKLKHSHDFKQNTSARKSIFSIEKFSTEKNFISGLLVVISVLLFSLHCLYDGFLVGAMSTMLTTWIVTIVISAHKWAVGFALAIYMKKIQLSPQMFYASAFLFSISSSLGVIFSMFLMNMAESKVTLIVNSISIGTFLCFGFELIRSVLTDMDVVFSWFDRIITMLFVVFGGLFMLLLTFLEIAMVPHEHAH